MPLLLLRRLQHVQLPVRITDPDEARRVSVLLATGLVEAESAVLKSNLRHAVTQVVTVRRITEAGFSELAKFNDRPGVVEDEVRFRGGLRLL